MNANNSTVRVIAFYLPQFHPTPYNDRWWGKGFTEWSFVTKAKPLFPGHEQPLLPADLGFYDLRLPEITNEQARLAKQYGIDGFCYYYYWFNGTKLLDKPLANMLASEEPVFPFCICWANENWTRRWDGSDDQLLIGQTHTEETDTSFIREVLPIFDDNRYIRVDGKPLLIVYRADLLVNPVKTTENWRHIAVAHGLPGLYLCAVETFGLTEPRQFGFDAAIEFPPHGVSAKEITNDLQHTPATFSGKVYDYADAVRHAINRPEPGYPLHRGVMPRWDNTARRGRNAHIYFGSSPDLYQTWLRSAISYALQHNNSNARLVFVNAWNEWAEGAHLEPDQLYGHEYLKATRSAIRGLGKWSDTLTLLQGEICDDRETRLHYLSDLKMNLIAQQQSLSYFLSLAKQQTWQRTVASYAFCCSDEVPSFVKGRRCGDGGLITLDQVNDSQYANGNPTYPMLVDKRYAVFVRGWAFHEGFPTVEDSPLIFLLQSVETSNRHIAYAFSSREQRPDVAKVHRTFDENVTLWSGFRARLDLNAIAPGRYLFGVVFTDFKTAKKAVSSRNIQIV